MHTAQTGPGLLASVSSASPALDSTLPLVTEEKLWKSGRADTERPSAVVQPRLPASPRKTPCTTPKISSVERVLEP